MALLAILDQNWEAVYAWLGVGLIVELYEGARRHESRTTDASPAADSPSDLGPSTPLIVVIFLNSVFVPIFLLVHAGFLEGPFGLVIAALVLWSAQYHLTFCTWGDMPTAYVGFPAAWNLVAFYLHAFDATPIAAVLVIGLGVIATLIPLPWPHPLRVTGWSHVGRLGVMVWLGTAAVTLWKGFPTTPAAKAVFVLCIVGYLAVVLKAALDNRVRIEPPQN